MTPKEAQQVIETLAAGIDPETGEVLPRDNPLNNPQVVRALFVAAKALDQQAGKRDRPRAAAAANAGKPWTEAQDQQLAAAFDAGTTLAELTRAHGRTRGAITSRLIRLGRIQPGNAPPNASPSAAAAPPR